VRPAQPRLWPVAPLLETRSRSRLARAVGASGETVARACEDGLSTEQAWTWCDRLGLHPWLVWPELSWAATEDWIRVCAAADCTVEFVDGRVDKRYCSAACWHRMYRRSKKPEKRVCEAPDCDSVFALDNAARRFCSSACQARNRYQTDEGYRERQKAKRRAFYAKKVADYA
jgi:hypothetical protein